MGLEDEGSVSVGTNVAVKIKSRTRMGIIQE